MSEKTLYILTTEKTKGKSIKETKLSCDNSDEIHVELNKILRELTFNDTDFLTITILKQKR